MFSKKTLELAKKAFNSKNAIYDKVILEPKRKPWIIRTDFDKSHPKEQRLGYASLRFKRKRDAMLFMAKILALYRKGEK